MSEILDDIKTYATLTRQYLDVKLETAKIRAKLVASEMASLMILGLVISSMVGIALLIISFGLAETIGNSLGDPALGYYVVGGIYLLLAIILFFVGKSFLKRMIQNAILRKLDEHE